MKKTMLLLCALVLLAGYAVANELRAIQAQGVADQHLTKMAQKMKLDRGTTLQARSIVMDDMGQSHVRYQQFFNGVRVFSGDAIAHVIDRENRVAKTTDALRRGINVGVIPGIGRDEALAIANRDFNPRGEYKNRTVELIVFPTSGKQYSLAYMVRSEIENKSETRHEIHIISAKSGKILDHWNALETTDANGAGNSQYSGNVTVKTNSISGGYEMRDMTRGNGGNVTYNLNHATSGTGTIYTDADNSWGDGQNYVEGSSTTAANGQTAAVDAAYGLQQTWDYYKNIHARNGIDNAGTKTYSRVHYSNGYDNAFWSDSCFCMTYGDGTSFKTLTSLDVAGHEMTHGVTARTAGLNYRRESGGLNESSSDIFGTMVEFYTRPNSANYDIGEQLYSTAGKALRYMYNPNKDGASANCYSKNVGSLDVHYSSGVGNHFYYLLAEGSNPGNGLPSSPTCNGTGVTGIGRAKAEKIYFRALTVYMTSSTNYAGARTACLNAASDLYGATSPERNAVNAAWAAVNVK